MAYSYDQRIARAEEIAGEHPAAREVLDFYAKLARFQKRIFEDVSARGETDVESLAAWFPQLRDLVSWIGPKELLEAGTRAAPRIREQLAQFWSGQMVEEWFFTRVLTEPFAESLAARGKIDAEWNEAVCPFCGGRAGVAVLRGEGDGGKRSLICSLCSTEWVFRRILCPNCGEENKDQLPVYIAQELEHVRVEACDSCKCYIKAVDLTKNGRAVPVVDEIATIPLNIWAEEHGYLKIAPNVMGM